MVLIFLVNGLFILQHLSTICIVSEVICRVAYGRLHASEENQAQLKSCYSSVLSLCEKKGITTVVFPSLGTRAHHYPLEEATQVGVMTIVNMLKEENHFDRIVLCTHNGRDSEVVNRVVQECLKEME